jgi:hypothetical protein
MTSNTLVDGIEVVDIETGKTEHIIMINPPVEDDSGRLERTENGLWINMDHERFFTRYRYVKDSAE